jgi:rSAM/selenodomain-associated transferase 2
MVPNAQPVVAVSVVIPVRNDRTSLISILRQLAELAPAAWEVLVVDGGSTDGSPEAAERRGVRVISAEASRGVQQDLGFRGSVGTLVWLLHADSFLSARVIAELQQLCEQTASRGVPVWGRFDVQMRTAGGASRAPLRVVETLMNWRSRVTGICTGDQGIFASRDLLAAIDGVPQQVLMEDIELSRRLKRLQRPVALGARLGTSGRRWETQGLMRTVALMWKLRLQYFLGASPEQLARRYYS